MNLDAIKAKLDALNNTGQEKEKVDYTTIFWRPQEGKQMVRIVPSLYEPENLFSELKFHNYNIFGYPAASLSNWQKQDPIEDFVKELRKTNERENWQLAGTLQPRTKYFVPVIVRGEEDKGVRLWGFGITLFKALAQLASEDDIGDFTDVINGRDLKVTQVPGNPYPETTILPAMKESPLSDNAELVQLWKTQQPDPMEVHRQLDYDLIKQKLSEYLKIDSSELGGSAGVTSKESTPEKSNFTLETATLGNKDTVSEFDDLFNE